MTSCGGYFGGSRSGRCGHQIITIKDLLRDSSDDDDDNLNNNATSSRVGPSICK